MPIFTDPDKPDPRQVVCVFGSGNALRSNNHIAVIRVFVAFHQIFDRTDETVVALFGCHQPSMTDTDKTEAQTMQTVWNNIRESLRNLPPAMLNKLPNLLGTSTRPEDLVLHDTPDINATSTTCAAIVKHYLANGDHVHLVMNWPYMRRTLYLMRMQAERAGLNWQDVRNRVHPVPCNGTFWPYFRENPLKAPFWWLYKVAVREVGATLKAHRDPYSERYNQKRTF